MSFIDIIMESSVKLFDMNKKFIFIIIAMIIYSIQPLLFYNVMKKSMLGIGLTNIIWNIVSSIIVLLFSIIYFDEKIKKTQTLGIILGIISLYLIGYNNFI